MSVLGNFSYQYFTQCNWGIAIERSFLQCGAIFALWLVLKFGKSEGFNADR